MRVNNNERIKITFIVNRQREQTFHTKRTYWIGLMDLLIGGLDWRWPGGCGGEVWRWVARL